MPSNLRVKGFGGRELSRDLDALRLGLARKLLPDARRETTGLVAGRAQRLAPVGPGPRANAKHADDRLPHLRDTITGIAAGVATTHPGGPVHEFGGTIAPNGAPITIRASHMAERAGAASVGDAERLMARRLEDLLAEHGLG